MVFDNPLSENFPSVSVKVDNVTDCGRLTGGPLVRIGPNVVMYSDSETFSRVVGVRSPYTKGSFYSSVKVPPLTDNVFSETGPEEHKAMRAKLAGGVSAPFPFLFNFSHPPYSPFFPFPLLLAPSSPTG